MNLHRKAGMGYASAGALAPPLERPLPALSATPATAARTHALQDWEP